MEDSAVKSVDILLKDNLIWNLKKKLHQNQTNKINCELMLTYDTPALRQTGSRNLMDPKTLPTI